MQQCQCQHLFFSQGLYRMFVHLKESFSHIILFENTRTQVKYECVRSFLFICNLLQLVI